MKMMDINLLSRNSLVKGEKIIKELQTIVPDRPLEDLTIPCTIVATDMLHTEEVVFRTGSLFEAVRASISIPLFFSPVQMGDRLLIDGGIMDPLPLHVVQRKEGDILVAMDISGKDGMPLDRKVNFVSILDRMSDLQIQQNTLLSLRLTPPDVHAVMRQYAYTTFDFDKAEEIIKQGYQIMNDALEAYEAKMH
jgi:NTE family protein